MFRPSQSQPPINVLLLDGESLFTPKVVRALAVARRWRMHVLAQVADAGPPALAWSRHLKSFHLTPADGGDARYLATIREVVAQTGAEIIMPVTEATSLFCIRHRTELEEIARLAPLAQEDTFATGIDKGLLAAFMAAHAIPHPRTCLVSALATSGLRYPLLLKPRRGNGGSGLVRVDSPAALRRELALRPDSADMCVQEFIAGEDQSCSVLAHEGRILAWTSQRGLRRHRAYAVFSEIQVEASQAAHAAAARLMQALNWSGVANIDLRIDARTGAPLILEINGRYWDSLWASLAARVNFPDLACRLALGEPLPAVQLRPGRFIRPSALPGDLLRLRPRLLRFRWNGLSLLLGDPLPELIRCTGTFLERTFPTRTTARPLPLLPATTTAPNS